MTEQGARCFPRGPPVLFLDRQETHGKGITMDNTAALSAIADITMDGGDVDVNDITLVRYSEYGDSTYLDATLDALLWEVIAHAGQGAGFWLTVHTHSDRYVVEMWANDRGNPRSAWTLRRI